MISISSASSTIARTLRQTQAARRQRRLEQKAAAMKTLHDRLFLEGKCINHTNKTPHAPRRPNGRRCEHCCEIRRKVAEVPA